MQGNNIYYITLDNMMDVYKKGAELHKRRNSLPEENFHVMGGVALTRTSSLIYPCVYSQIGSACSLSPVNGQVPDEVLDEIKKERVVLYIKEEVDIEKVIASLPDHNHIHIDDLLEAKNVVPH